MRITTLSRRRSTSARRYAAVFIASFLIIQTVAFIFPTAWLTPVRAISTTIVIGEFRFRGPSGGNDEFVEIRNISGATVNISGYKLRGCAAGSGAVSDRATVPANTLLPAGQTYLFANNNATGGFSNAGVTPDQTYGTGFADLVNTAGSNQSGARIEDASAGVIDGVGAPSSPCREGTGITHSTTNGDQSFQRKPLGTNNQDTDNNANDFQGPQTGTPTACGAACASSTPTPTPTPAPTPALAINNVSQVEGNSGQTAFTFTVSLSPANTTQTVTVNYATANGTTNPATGGASCGAGVDYISANGTLTFAPNDTSEQITVQVCGDTAGEPNETFFVNLSGASNAGIADSQGLGTITNDDFTFLLINQVQGSTPSGNANSPRLGEPVTVRGIVTLLKSNGFFLQEEVSDNDSDPNTSEGIFVFVDAAPTIAVGDQVTVNGTVVEFNGLTEITTSNANVSINNTGNAPPTAVTLTPTDLPPTAAHTQPQLEKYESMRVSAASLTTVAPNDEFFDVWTVLTGQPRPFREPGIEADETVPPDPTSGTPDPNIPRFDMNPERLSVDTNGRAGSTNEAITSNVVLTNVTGPLDYSFGAYRLVPEAALTRTPNMSAVPVPTPASQEFTVAGFNIENFNNNATQRQKAALAIRDVLHLPDIIGLSEIFDLADLQALAAEIQAISGVNYSAHLVEADGASEDSDQDVAFLVKTSRVKINSVTQIEKAGCNGLPANCNTYSDPNTGNPALLNDRPPLVLDANVAPSGANVRVFVVINHLRSFIDIEGDGAEARRVRAKRKAQAEFLAQLLQDLQTNNPSASVISVGDYNAFQFSDGYTDPISVIKGNPTPDDQIVVDQSPDLVNPNFYNLIEDVPASERYSFIFEGTPQVLDHHLVNTVARARNTRTAIARVNADFPENPAAAFASNAARPERNSDHDPVVSYYSLIAGALIISEMSPRGSIGSLDEFVEVFNNTDNDHTVAATDASGGYGIAAEDGQLRCTIPNGTVIPARGHFLCAGAQYSYGSEVAPDASFVIAPPTFGDIGDQQGVALFTSAVDFSAGTKLDAFGYTTSPALYREGSGYPVAVVVNLPHSYVRTQYGGYEADTNSNGSDFISVNSRLDVCCDPQSSLGMPGPQNLTSPRVRLGQQPVTLFDPNVGASTAPNRERSGVVVPNGQNGTLRFRRTITNNTATPVTRMKIRVVDISTLNSPTTAQNGKPTPCFAPCADLRVLSSSDEAAVATSTGPKPTSGTTLDFSTFQPLGGGYNSSLNVNQVSGGTPLAPTTSINVNMLVGIMRGGTARFFFFVEAAP